MNIVELETVVRPAVFLAVLLAMAAWEIAAPCREMERPKLARWSQNLGLLLVDAAVVRIVMPMTVVAAALWFESRGIGLLPLLGVPYPLAVFIAVIVLDLAIYAQHVVFHYVPMLWRIHRVHHADTDFDVTTGLRFHPIEILLSLMIKIGVAALIGAPALAVLIFEVILNASSQFSHGNIRLPKRVDAVLRRVIVTPDMHRVHHSIHRHETDSNFGFNLSIWDRLFGTYIPHPKDGQTGMTIGIDEFRAKREMWLDRLLTQPFRKE